MNEKQIKFLAETFRNMLAAEIGKKNFAEMKRRNRKEKAGLNADESADHSCKVCHSHDFCDANMVMYAAFIDVTGEETCFTPKQVALWNAAWEYAFVNYLS